MNELLPFLCSFWQGEYGADIYSDCPDLVSDLDCSDLRIFLAHRCEPHPSSTGYALFYRTSPHVTYAESLDRKTMDITGPYDLLRRGEAIPYLACGLLEVQRQAAGQVTAHAAAVSSSVGAAVLLGKEGAGKTSVALRLCLTYGYRLIGNDLVRIGLEGSFAWAFDGSKFFWLRKAPMRSNHPHLLKYFTPEAKGDEWTERAVVLPHQLNIAVETTPVPIRRLFLLRVDNGLSVLYQERSWGRWPRLYLYENFSRYIRRSCSPLMGGDNFRYLVYLPSLDCEEFHRHRAMLIDHLIERLGITYLSGCLDAVARRIHLSMMEEQKDVL
jgi:hypothetical protein